MSDSSVVTTASARALASRRNGAQSRGPKTAAGKASSARNALKHGLCARKFLMLPQEDPLAFAALEEALLAELAPVGALQTVLAERVVSAAWRLVRADRLEVEVLEVRRYGNPSLGLALVRDGNGTNSSTTVMRYRGAALAELQRALTMLQALQAKAAAAAEPPAPPARRRGRPLGAPNEPDRTRQIKGLTAGRGAAPPPDARRRHPLAPLAPSATPAETTPSRDVTPKPPLDLPAPGRSSQASDRDRAPQAPLLAHLAAAKRTRDAAPDPGPGARAPAVTRA